MRKIYLASTSPRRRKLMDSLGIEFEVLSPNFDENRITNSNPSVYVSVNAYQKAHSVFSLNSQDIVIAADTIVVLEGDILGKPTSKEDAFRMLRSLSGRTHEVMTGLSILSKEEKLADTFISEVTFRTLTDNEIDEYLRMEEYLDKAGSYAIQGKGSNLVFNYNGNIETIIGMPTAPIKEFLKRVQING